MFFLVLGIRDENFPSPALCHRQSSFVLMREDGVWVSRRQFHILNNTVSCPQSIHHCPDQLLRGCRWCPLSLCVDPEQLALSASPSPLLQQTGLISMMINMVSILRGHSLSGFAFLNTHLESPVGALEMLTKLSPLLLLTKPCAGVELHCHVCQ